MIVLCRRFGMSLSSLFFLVGHVVNVTPFLVLAFVMLQMLVVTLPWTPMPRQRLLMMMLLIRGGDVDDDYIGEC